MSSPVPPCVPPVVVHLAGHGNAGQSGVEPTLPGIPFEITNHILSFTPHSVHACLSVSQRYRQIGEEYLLELAQRVTEISSDSSLHGLIQSLFAGFILQRQSNPRLSTLQFHLSLFKGIDALRVLEGPNRILSLEEIGQCDKRLQDTNLPKIWEPLREQIMEMGPEPAGLPAVDATAQQIRTWMHAASSQHVLQRLTCLDLSRRALTCVPLEIQLCTALQALHLNNNQIATLYQTIFEGLSSLQRLYLARNQIVTLPQHVFQGLSSLQRLYLARNQIVTLPQHVFQGLPSLLTLDLFGNQIATLSQPVFQGLSSLQWLDLSSNLIAILPQPVFQELSSLQTLDLHGNRIATLPQNIFQGLPSLQMLYLASNRIATLPQTIFQGLFSLQHLSLYGNPQLLISYKNLEMYSNNLEFLEMMHAFFNYTCQTPFAQFYRLAAEEGSPDVVRESFSGLPDNIKNGIRERAWVEPGSPVFDDMRMFYGALKRYVMDSFEGLDDDQKNGVYRRVCELAQRESGAENQNWGKVHAFDNILRLIDALSCN